MRPAHSLAVLGNVLGEPRIPEGAKALLVSPVLAQACLTPVAFTLR